MTFLVAVILTLVAVLLDKGGKFHEKKGKKLKKEKKETFFIIKKLKFIWPFI